MRVCDDCGKWMRQGFVIDAGVKYFCEDCHPKHYTPEQWEIEYANGEGESYWTEWEDGEPCRECGEDASAGDRPTKEDPLCWECHREIYGEE